MITNYTTAKSQINNIYDGYISELSIEGIANGIEDLYNNNKLLESLSQNCKSKNYNNKDELDILYKLLK